jgi:hypothetical protein
LKSVHGRRIERVASVLGVVAVVASGRNASRPLTKVARRCRRMHAQRTCILRHLRAIFVAADSRAWNPLQDWVHERVISSHHAFMGRIPTIREPGHPRSGRFPGWIKLPCDRRFDNPREKSCRHRIGASNVGESFRRQRTPGRSRMANCRIRSFRWWYVALQPATEKVSHFCVVAPDASPSIVVAKPEYL